MSIQKASPEARASITEKCLIAFDVDKTILAQNNNEEEMFLKKVAPELTTVASEGSSLAVVTGNSMHELSSRFLKMLIKQLCHTKDLDLIDNFHFFCNSGGVYAHFSKEDKALKKLIQQGNPTTEAVMEAITVPDGEGLAIHPRFIDANYIERCRISEKEEKIITDIMKKVADNYMKVLKAKPNLNDIDFNLTKLKDDNGNWIKPKPNRRHVAYGKGKKASTQITLKPLMSYNHANDKALKNKLFNTPEDLRNAFTEDVQTQLIEKGLGHYIARPGGTSSIDVTRERLDKAYGLEFLIDRLNLQGSPARKEEFGSNTIYFGDEVMVGDKGNDYAVTRIPGLLVFAVNADRSHVPFRSNIIIPSKVTHGPDATAAMLSKFNECAATLLATYDNPEAKTIASHKTALDHFKKQFFIDRIDNKLSTLKDANNANDTAKDWQAVHTFVTLMSRDNPAAKKWLSIMTDQLDTIMEQLATNKEASPRALGANGPHSNLE